MKHKLYHAMIALCIGMLFAACSGRPLEQKEPAVSAAESTEASFSWESPVESETDQPLPNMLYARDKLFVSTGRKAILTCGTADGNIASVTAPNQEPSKTDRPISAASARTTFPQPNMQWLWKSMESTFFS